MKRFYETTKWDDPWFAALPFKSKMAWDYLLSKCDNAGVWSPNFPLAEFQIGTKIDWSDFKEQLGDRLRIVRGGKWWVPSFVKFQFGKLGPDARVHQSVVKLLESHGLLSAYEKWYSDVTAIPCQSDSNGIAIPQGQEQEKEQGQGQEPEQEVAGSAIQTELVPMPDCLLTEAFKAKWEEYVAYRREGRMKALQPASVRKQWLEMAKWGHDAAVLSIDITIRNSWQGLFEPTKGGTNANHRTGNSRGFSQQSSFAGITDKGG
jgi:hypothetical protein